MWLPSACLTWLKPWFVSRASPVLQNPQWRWFSCPVVVSVISEGLGLVAGQVRLPLWFHDSKNQLLISIAPNRWNGKRQHASHFLEAFSYISPVQRAKRSEAKKGILGSPAVSFRNKGVGAISLGRLSCGAPGLRHRAIAGGWAGARAQAALPHL